MPQDNIKPKLFYDDIFSDYNKREDNLNTKNNTNNNTYTNIHPVFYKRYQNKYFSDSKVLMYGNLDIKFTKVFKFLLPLFKLAGTLVPYEGKNVETEVTTSAHENSSKIRMVRVFKFKDNKTWDFSSELFKWKKNTFIELAKFNLAWKYKIKYNNNKLSMIHQGYGLWVFSRCIPLPGLSFLIGRPYAQEQALDESRFSMILTLTHPILGKFFSYRGDFVIIESNIIDPSINKAQANANTKTN